MSIVTYPKSHQTSVFPRYGMFSVESSRAPLLREITDTEKNRTKISTICLVYGTFCHFSSNYSTFLPPEPIPSLNKPIPSLNKPIPSLKLTYPKSQTYLSQVSINLSQVSNLPIPSLNKNSLFVDFKAFFHALNKTKN